MRPMRQIRIERFNRGKKRLFVVDAGDVQAVVAFRERRVEVWCARPPAEAYRRRGRYPNIEEACAAASNDENLRVALESVRVCGGGRS